MRYVLYLFIGFTLPFNVVTSQCHGNLNSQFEPYVALIPTDSIISSAVGGNFKVESYCTESFGFRIGFGYNAYNFRSTDEFCLQVGTFEFNSNKFKELSDFQNSLTHVTGLAFSGFVKEVSLNVPVEVFYKLYESKYFTADINTGLNISMINVRTAYFEDKLSGDEISIQIPASQYSRSVLNLTASIDINTRLNNNLLVGISPGIIRVSNGKFKNTIFSLDFSVVYSLDLGRT